MSVHDDKARLCQFVLKLDSHPILTIVFASLNILEEFWNDVLYGELVGIRVDSDSACNWVWFCSVMTDPLWVLEELSMGITFLQANDIPEKLIIASTLVKLLLEELLAVIPSKEGIIHFVKVISEALGKNIPAQYS